jgi:hypothetical protein
MVMRSCDLCRFTDPGVQRGPTMAIRLKAAHPLTQAARGEGYGYDANFAVCGFCAMVAAELTNVFELEFPKRFSC